MHMYEFIGAYVYSCNSQMINLDKLHYIWRCS